MKTVKLKIAKPADILSDMRTFNNIMRLAFNRYQDGFDENQIRRILRQLFPDCNCWIIHCAVRVAGDTYRLSGGKKVIFGGKRNLFAYLKGRITKESFKYRRMAPITIQGEKNARGNRLFEFNFEKNSIIYKPSKTRHVPISISPVRKKLNAELCKVGELAHEKKIPVTIKLSNLYIWISYDETRIYQERFSNLKPNRILGIDMNPNAIGVSIIELSKNNSVTLMHKRVYDLSGLTTPSGKAACHKKSKYRTNKLKHETIAIAHDINKMVNEWKCNSVAIEHINIQPCDWGKGPTYNRTCNNKWTRQIFTGKLKMLANIYGWNIVEINPAYSSIVGNFTYGNENTPDMVAAATEIARRAYKKFEKGWFYPKFNVERLDEQWKQTLSGVKTWKDLFLKVKESGRKYRFLLTDCIRNAVFRKHYPQKNWKVYIFPLN